MSIFKIKIEPIVKNRDWEVRNIGSNRKAKVCKVCQAILPIGGLSTTFTKRITTGSSTRYATIHTCIHNNKPECSEQIAKGLGIDLESSYVRK